MWSCDWPQVTHELCFTDVPFYMRLIPFLISQGFRPRLPCSPSWCWSSPSWCACRTSVSVTLNTSAHTTTRYELRSCRYELTGGSGTLTCSPAETLTWPRSRFRSTPRTPTWTGWRTDVLRDLHPPTNLRYVSLSNHYTSEGFIRCKGKIFLFVWFLL